MKVRARARFRTCRRAGVILLVVLIVVVALSVTVYTFSRHMLIELAITRAGIDSQQQRLLCDSVVEQLLVSDRQALQRLCSSDCQDIGSSSTSTVKMLRVGTHPGLGSIKLQDGEHGYMAILGRDPRSTPRPLGLSNESAKLNLNSLAGRRLSRKQAVAKLMRYKDLSEPTAEGIANVLGVFDSRTNVQIENTAPNQSFPSNILTSMTELLNVPGVTQERLLGEDRNANGILDWNENDGDESWPPDNADGVLDAGWSADWTLIGAESNYRANRERKIDLNQKDLVMLYDQISQFATPEEARFVVAWRISSPVYTDTSSVDEAARREETANELATSFDERLARQLGTDGAASGKTSPSNSSSPNSSVPNSSVPLPSDQPKVRAGLNLGVHPARKLRSLLDLSSCQLQLIIDGKDTILVSPFANDPTSLSRWLPLWEERTSVTSGDSNPSRINILQASPATLTTVEGVSDELAKAIVKQRATLHQAGVMEVSGSRITSVAWLLEVGLVTTAELRRMGDEITVGGDVFQGFAVGQLQMSRTASVKFVELDGRSGILKVRRMMEMPTLSSTERLPIVE